LFVVQDSYRYYRNNEHGWKEKENKSKKRVREGEGEEREKESEREGRRDRKVRW
jgi:hypothetical protein